LIGYSKTLYEIKADSNEVIYMSASPLIDLFQKNLEMLFVFGLAICAAIAGNPTVENENY
jgi:hypothetical protein